MLFPSKRRNSVSYIDRIGTERRIRSFFGLPPERQKLIQEQVTRLAEEQSTSAPEDELKDIHRSTEELFIWKFIWKHAGKWESLISEGKVPTATEYNSYRGEQFAFEERLERVEDDVRDLKRPISGVYMFFNALSGGPKTVGEKPSFGRGHGGGPFSPHSTSKL